MDIDLREGLRRGDTVRSLSGRDRNSLYVLIGNEGERVLLSDGERHPFEKAKRKNPKHLELLSETFRLGSRELSEMEKAPTGSGNENSILRRHLKKLQAQQGISKRKE